MKKASAFAAVALSSFFAMSSLSYAQSGDEDWSAEQAKSSTFEVHETIQSDHTPYATGLFLAYVKGADETTNALSQEGLLALTKELYKRTGIEPAGIVGLDLEKDDVSLFPFIYWLPSEQTPRLSEQARARIQDHLAKPGKSLFLNPSSSSNLENYTGLLKDLGSKPLQAVEEGSIWTQSFYITDKPHDVFTETIPADSIDVTVPSLLFSDQNFALEWIGSKAGIGPDVHDNAIRFGVNILSATLMGTYKLDPDHGPTIEHKRRLREEAANRAQDEVLTPIPRKDPPLYEDFGGGYP